MVVKRIGSRMGAVIIAFLIAWVAGTLIGTVVQTQFNLLALQNLGVAISLEARWTATLHDLLNFAPLYAALFGTGFLLSQALAAPLLTRLPGWMRGPGHAVAAAAGLWTAFAITNALLPMPTLIAATRSVTGLLAMLLTAAWAGWLFVRLAATRRLRRGAVSPVVACVLVLGSLGFTDTARAQKVVEDYQVETVASGLEHPWSVAFLPDGGALVTERAGRLRRITPEGQLVKAPIKGVPSVFNSAQAGLFDVVLSPDFADDRRIFLAYACGTEAANQLCVARAQLQQSQLTGVVEIFRARPAKEGSAHYGGRMVWLPDDTLIVTLGDGFDYREQAQKLSSHLGKIIRLNPDGSAPADNPFVGREGALPEIYSYGHRNVQGLVYDAREDLLLAHEHGPRGGDEINVIEPGKNYGWPIISYGIDYTGAMITPYTAREGMKQPLLQWTPSIAPSGMTRYRGHLFPEWQGDLLVGALAARNIHRVTLNRLQANDAGTLFGELDARIRDVATGPDGALYLLTDSPDGKLLRVTPLAGSDVPSSEVELALSPGQLDWIGEQIFRNECAGQTRCLVHWNAGEAFPSLGIGHFIWYPAGVEGRFVESFPALVDFMRRRNVELPESLAELRPFDAPWADRDAFLQVSDSASVEDLRAFLMKTRAVQTEFIYHRARESLSRVIGAAPNSKTDVVTARVAALSETPGGVYALIDYVNFKGEGLAESERYNGEGWGLLQVLLAMSGHPADTALDQFREAAARVLTRRADNAEAPIERERWLPGWLKRVETYVEPASTVSPE